MRKPIPYILQEKTFFLYYSSQSKRRTRGGKIDLKNKQKLQLASKKALLQLQVDSSPRQSAGSYRITTYQLRRKRPRFPVLPLSSRALVPSRSAYAVSAFRAIPHAAFLLPASRAIATQDSPSAGVWALGVSTAEIFV